MRKAAGLTASSTPVGRGDAVGKPQGDRRDAARMSRYRSTDAAGRIVRAASGQYPFQGEIYFGERGYVPVT